MLNKFVLLSFFQLFLFVQLVGQDDSLWGVWQNKATHDTVRLEAYKTYIWEEYMFYDPDSALILSKDLYLQAALMDERKYMGGALNHQAVALSLGGKMNDAIGLYEKAIDIYLQNNLELSAAATYSNLGSIFNEKGDFKKTAEYYFKALKIYEVNHEEAKLAKVYNNLGVLYNEQKMFSLALDYFEKSIEIKLKIGDDQEIGQAYLNLGALYGDLNDLNLAKKFTMKSLDYLNRANDLRGTANYYLNMGHLWFKVNNFDSSLYYYENALEVFTKIDDKIGEVNAEINMGTTYSWFGERELAAMYLVDAYKKAKEFKMYLGQREAAKALFELYEAMRDYKSAFYFKKEYHVLNDSLTNIAQQEQTLNLKFEHDYEKKAFADSLDYAKSQELNLLKLSEQEAQIKKDRTEKYALFGGMGLLLLFGAFAYHNFRRKKRDHDTIALQHQKLELNHHEIKQSIDYAKRLQDVFMPSIEVLNDHFPNHFLLFKPKDVVSGDFYWFEFDRASQSKVIAVADCTGHGVPGALVSIVCSSALNKVVREMGILEPADILNETRKIIIETFRKTGQEVRDGMDITICVIKNEVVKVAAANNGLWLLKGNANPKEIEELKANRQTVGWAEVLKPFTQQTLELEKGDTIYLLTDGFQDQFGGEKGKKLKKAPLKKMIVQMHEKSMNSQLNDLNKLFEEWRGDCEQVDDVCVLGIRL